MIVSSATGVKAGEILTVKEGWEEYAKENGIEHSLKDKDKVTVTGYRLSAASPCPGVRVRGFVHPARFALFVPLDFLLRS